MLNSSNRREFCRSVAGFAGSFSMLASRVSGQQAPASMNATKLAHNLVLITGGGANVVLVTGPDNTVMIDGGLPDRSAELLKLVAEQSPGTASARCLTRTGIWITPVRMKPLARLEPRSSRIETPRDG